MKAFQSTGEASRHPRENIQHIKKKEMYLFFLWGGFLPSWIRIRIPNSDPHLQLNLESGSETSTTLLPVMR
jgi:hypothetical protein